MEARRVLATAILALFALALAPGPADARKALASPFLTKPVKRASGGDFFCPAPPLPPRDLFFKSMYEGSDSHRATVNARAHKRYLRDTADIRRYENDLIVMANKYIRTGNPEAAACALDWLHIWAEAGALRGEVNAEGSAMRQWTLATLASAYAQVRGAAIPSPEKRKKIEIWLSACAEDVIGDYPRGSGLARHNNNHLYWAAWAVAMAGIAVDNPDFYRWGVDKAKFTLIEEISHDGTLPLEMKRGQKALQYHIVALTPLVMIAEAALVNGDDLYELGDGALHRLVARVMAGMADPLYFEQQTDIEQLPVTELYPGYHAWMEVYQARFPRDDIARRLDDLRPLFFRRTGGNMGLVLP